MTMAGEISAIESAIKAEEMQIMKDFARVKEDCQRFLDDAKAINGNVFGYMDAAILELKSRINAHIFCYQQDCKFADGLKSAIDAIHGSIAGGDKRAEYLRDVSVRVTARLPEDP